MVWLWWWCSRVTSAAGPRAPCDSYNIVIAMTVITSRKVFLHNQHYSQFRGEWATGNARAREKIESTMPARVVVAVMVAAAMEEAAVEEEEEEEGGSGHRSWWGFLDGSGEEERDGS